MCDFDGDCGEDMDVECDVDTDVETDSDIGEEIDSVDDGVDDAFEAEINDGFEDDLAEGETYFENDIDTSFVMDLGTEDTETDSADEIDNLELPEELQTGELPERLELESAEQIEESEPELTITGEILDEFIKETEDTDRNPEGTWLQQKKDRKTLSGLRVLCECHRRNSGADWRKIHYRKYFCKYGGKLF